MNRILLTLIIPTVLSLVASCLADDPGTKAAAALSNLLDGVDINIPYLAAGHVSKFTCSFDLAFADIYIENISLSTLDLHVDNTVTPGQLLANLDLIKADAGLTIKVENSSFGCLGVVSQFNNYRVSIGLRPNAAKPSDGPNIHVAASLNQKITDGTSLLYSLAIPDGNSGCQVQIDPSVLKIDVSFLGWLVDILKSFIVSEADKQICTQLRTTAIQDKLNPLLQTTLYPLLAQLASAGAMHKEFSTNLGENAPAILPADPSPGNL
eukprot:g3646.t1